MASREALDQWTAAVDRLLGPEPPYEPIPPRPRPAGDPTLVPDWVLVWNVHCGGVAPGARDREIMGSDYTFDRRPNDHAVLWRDENVPSCVGDPGPPVGIQGTVAMAGLWVRGIAKVGTIVVPVHDEAGRDGGLDALRSLADRATATWATRWWAPALVGQRDGSFERGVLFEDRDVAVLAAEQVGAPRLLQVRAPFFDDEPSPANVAVTDLDGHPLGQAYRFPTIPVVDRNLASP